VSLPNGLNHRHHSGAAIEGGGRDEDVCPAQCARRRPDDGGADSRCHRPQRNDDGVSDNLRRPAARSVAQTTTKYAHVLDDELRDAMEKASVGMAKRLLTLPTSNKKRPKA
jgi:hypothetical protein